MANSRAAAASVEPEHQACHGAACIRACFGFFWRGRGVSRPDEPVFARCCSSIFFCWSCPKIGVHKYMYTYACRAYGAEGLTAVCLCVCSHRNTAGRSRMASLSPWRHWVLTLNQVPIKLHLALPRLVIHNHTCARICTYTYVYVHVFAYILVHVPVRRHAHIRVHVHARS